MENISKKQYEDMIKASQEFHTQKIFFDAIKELEEENKQLKKELEALRGKLYASL